MSFGRFNLDQNRKKERKKEWFVSLTFLFHFILLSSMKSVRLRPSCLFKYFTNSQMTSKHWCEIYFTFSCSKAMENSFLLLCFNWNKRKRRFVSRISSSFLSKSKRHYNQRWQWAIWQFKHNQFPFLNNTRNINFRYF